MFATQPPSLVPFLMQGGMTAQPSPPMLGGAMVSERPAGPSTPDAQLGRSVPAELAAKLGLPHRAAPSFDQPAIAPQFANQFALDKAAMMQGQGMFAPSSAKAKPKFFGKGGVGQLVLMAISDALNTYSGRPAVFGPMLMRQRQMEMESEAEARKPFAMGRSLVQKGEDGAYHTIFEGKADPQPFEQYVSALGYAPGTPEYIDAVRDYRLGAWSDPAMENKTELEGIRYGYRDNLQDQRLDVTRRGQDIRATTARRGQDLTHGDRIRGQNLGRENNIRSNNTRRGAASYSNPGKGGNGPRAVAADGRPIVVKGGRWVYEADGRPVQ